MPMCHILDCRTLCPSPSGGYTGGPGRGHTAHTPYLMTAPLTPILYCSTLYLLVYKNCCTPMLWSYRPNGPRLPKAGAATTVCAPSFHTQQNRIDPPTHTHTHRLKLAICSDHLVESLRETLKAKQSGWSAISLFTRVLLPVPEGPLMTSGRNCFAFSPCEADK